MLGPSEYLADILNTDSQRDKIPSSPIPAQRDMTYPFPRSLAQHEEAIRRRQECEWHVERSGGERSDDIA